MSTLVYILLAVLVIVISGIGYWDREIRQPKENLRHTIGVNLGILTNELRELVEIAKKSQVTPDVKRATTLLEEAAEVLPIEALAAKASREELVTILSKVFAAMDKSTQARRLLGAIRTDHLE
jgi:hypothetical protein